MQWTASGRAVTAAAEGAFGAVRSARTTQLSAVVHHQNVKLVHPLFGHTYVQMAVGSLGGAPGRNPAQTTGHPMYVGIHGEVRPTQPKEQHAGDRLGSHSR